MLRFLTLFTMVCLLALAILPTGSSIAETASPEQAKIVAQNWLSVLVDQKGSWAGQASSAVGEVSPITQGGLVVGYCVDVEPQGYIIVPVLKEMPPVKAYSEHSNLDLDSGGVPELLQEVLAARADEFIKRYGSLDAVQPSTGKTMFIPGAKQSWDRLLQAPELFKRNLKLDSDEKIDTVGPLLTCDWDQGSPYNYFCPVGDGGRTLVGCVATAATQIMQYHRWPLNGNGSYSYYWGGDTSCEGSSPGQTLTVDLSDSYDWDNILDHASPGDTQQQIEAIGELNYEVAVTFRMDFGVCASGAVTSRILSVFPAYFRYQSGIDPEYRNHHSPETWFDVIKGEINLGRPMMYRIVGHAFVCDGWRELMGWDQYHMNYGWADDHTLWYTVDNLYDSEDLNAEALYRHIIPLRSSWEDGETGILADSGNAQGTCWFDLDGDDDSDLVLINESGLVLLRNDGGGEFTDISAGIPTGLTAGRAAAAGDFDNDGDPDLYLVRHLQANVLLRNDGGVFTDVTSGLLADAGQGNSASWIDFDRDGWLDLLWTNYDGSSHPSRLLRNTGGGEFADASPSALSGQLDTETAVWCDADADGDSDLYLVSYSYGNILLGNDGNGGFVDATTGLLGDSGAGTAATWGDMDGDGDPDLYLVNHGANVLLRNDGGTFVDATTPSTGNTGDGENATWFDQDNDGDLDLYVCNSSADNVLLRNNGTGYFSLADVGLVEGGSGNVASSVADVDFDGDLDIYLANSGANTFLNNELWVHNWIRVKLSGSISNAEGFGTRIRLANSDFSLTRWVGTDQDGLTQGDQTVHFGLGWYTQADTLEIQWPTGKLVTLTGIAGNQTVEIIEAPFVDVTAGPLADTGNARGVSWVDFDADGDQDLYVVNHGTANLLLRNDGGADFTSVGGVLADAGAGNGAAWADYDGDGDLDVYLTNEGTDNLMFQNDGSGVFNPAPVVGLNPGGDSFGASWTDFNQDGILDLYVVNNNSANNLYRGFGDIGGPWLFMGETSIVGDMGPGSIGVWGDYNGDTLPDLFLACAGDPDRLFSNSGALGMEDVTGLDVPVYYGTSRGAAWADFDNDGDLDLYVANDGQRDRLCMNNNGYLVEIDGGALADGGFSQCVAWGDYDNDADLDIFVTRYNQPNLLLRNDGEGVFNHALTILGDSGPLTTGVAWADYNGDGLLDLYLAADGANLLQTNAVRNDNHWLHLDLTATGPNTGAIGSRIRAVTGELSQLRVISAGTGFMSMDSHTVEFGLAQATVVDSLVINWPDGEVQILTNLAVDRKRTIVQGQGETPVEDKPQLPVAFGLTRAYPNPFNPMTRISFDLPEDRHVKLAVYSISGALVATLVDETRLAGRYEARWNGRDSQGQLMASGTYFFRMTAGEFSSTRRAVLLK